MMDREQLLVDGVLSSRLDAQNQGNNNNPATEHLSVQPANSRVKEKPEEVDVESDNSSHRQKSSPPKTKASKHRRRQKRKAQLFTYSFSGGRFDAQNQDNNKNPTTEHLPSPIMATNSRVEEIKPEEADDENDDSSQDDESSSSNRDDYYSSKTNANKSRIRSKKNAQQYQLRRQSLIRREQLIEMQKFRPDKEEEMYKEALQNTRNTIILVAILVATVTFAAGLTPPGGVYQEGPYIGRAVAGKSIAFRVFVLSNNIALVTSLCIVIVLVSIVPFKRKVQRRLLEYAHRAMWVAVAFMATAYVAAAWVTVPHHNQEIWVFVALISICGGSLGIAFIALTVKLVEHRLRKSKWRKEKRNREKEQQQRGKQAAELRAERIISLQRENIVELRQEGIVSLEREKEIEESRVIKLASFNSDYESSRHLGYHSVG